ncbi:YdaS family helix-turn-helix protein [Sphingomonas sp. PAMC 26605]|uniref:YdaS family helix-turn-helix protein n=1 Tax=Sphingomonas sp. PAMC 26605 TaxID=1112214 RepID=UPI00026CAC3B|nr:YdaS family helix-turn-helix protein [Sphingomonas sp. PAMC 26605]
MDVALTPFEAFELAVSKTESESEFARIVGCTPGNINQLLKKRSPLSHRFVLKAEAATGVSRHLLAPDIYPDESDQPPHRLDHTARNTGPLDDLAPAR